MIRGNDPSSTKFSGGVEAFEDKLKADEAAVEDAKEEEKQRRTQISSKTRNRLSKLLERKRTEAGSSRQER